MSEVIKNINLISLYDRYKNMLTDKQRNYFELYHFEDFTLQEIATKFSVSRSAILDSLNNVSKLLQNLEDNLHMDKNYKLINYYVDKALTHPDNLDEILKQILEVI